MKKHCQICKNPSYCGVYINDDPNKQECFCGYVCYKHFIIAFYDMAGKFGNLDGVRLEFEN